MNIGDAIREICELLKDRGIGEPRREAALLVELSINRDKAFLIAHPEYELTLNEKYELDDVVRRRANREPFQYISGRQEFFGLDFEVSPAVLIPRPETEILVERAIRILYERPAPTTFCEVGIGSGCIAISILYNTPESRAVGLDISREALDIAEKNAMKHDVDDRLSLMISDVYASIKTQTFDLIVSNPPYVPIVDVESLQPEVRDFEPRTSLTDGGSGLSIIEKIIAGAPRALTPGGELLIEIGFNQSSRVAEMFDTKVWNTPEFLPDLQGIPRTVHGLLRSEPERQGEC